MLNKLLIWGLTGLISLCNCKDRNKSDLEKYRATSKFKLEKKITSRKSYEQLSKRDETISINNLSQKHSKENSGNIPPLSEKLEEMVISKIYVSGLDFDIDVLPEVAIIENISSLYAIENPPLRKSHKQVSMKNEMISIKDLDYGKYKAMVFQNPKNKQDIKGFVYIPIVWLREPTIKEPPSYYSTSGELLRTPEYLKRSTMGLVEAINRYTNIKAEVEPLLFLDTPRLFKMPFLYITTDKEFELSKIEAENLGKYLRNGGFVVADNGMPQYEYSPAEASLKQMLKDALGNDARFEPIMSNSHPLYHCFFDFNDGAPQGNEIMLAFPSRISMMHDMLSRQETLVISLQGISINNRLVAIYSDKGYCHKWKDTTNNEPQLKMGVNMVVYALTQAGGITRNIMDQFSSIQ